MFLDYMFMHVEYMFDTANDKEHAVFGICFHIDSNGRYFIDSVFSRTRVKRMNVNFQTNEYYHVCFVFSNSLAHLYIDGQSKFNDWSINAPTQRIHATSLMIGFASNGLMFTGFLFDFNVFTKNFTQLQVQMVMKGKSKPTVTWEDVKQRFKNVWTVEF